MAELDWQAGMTRRAFVGSLAASLLSPTLGRAAAPPSADPDTAARLALVLQEFDRQGNHRTGTRPDLASAQWLTTELQAWRISATLETFAFERTDVVNAYVQLRERRIDGLPLFDASLTDSFGVVGRLGAPEANTEIAIVESTSPAWPALRTTTRAGAVVLITVAARPGLAPADAPDYQAPFGPPVLQVSSEEGTALRDEAQKGSGVRVVVEAKRTPAEGFNLVARIRGRDVAAPPLVVCATRSAWWRSTSERGGGLACLLELARALSSMRPLRDCVFVAVSGHEIGGVGIKALLGKHPELTNARAWLCLGPNLGARDRSARVVAASDQALAGLVRESATTANLAVDEVPAGDALGSDADRLPPAVARVRLGARGNPYRGLAADRWPDAADPATLAAEAKLAAELARRLALG